MGKISAPELLSAKHSITHFDCGKSPLNRWLVAFALQNQESRASRTYVVQLESRVVGYYALATASIHRQSAHRAHRHGEPDPIPAILLGQLAVDQNFHGLGIGSGLLRDAFFRAQQVTEIAGARIILLDAIDEEARQFYLAKGFKQSPMNDMLLMHSLII
jgi:GNAT superfamily N-acetyltransferase